MEVGREGLAIARRLGDIATLAEALVAVWLATVDPSAVDERALLAGELAQIAGRIGDPTLEFYAGLARFLTGSEQGDMAAADQGLAICTRIAEDLAQPLLRWRAAGLQAHRAFVDGRLDDVERWTEEALRFGEAAGQPDAATLYDLFIVRILQGRPDEAVELARPLVEAFGGAAAYPAILAWACAEAGRVEEGRANLARVRGATFGGLRRDYLWLATLSVLSRACARLGDTSAAEELYDLLRPHRSASVIGQSVWFGLVAYDLGLLAASLGRYADADAHFAAAVETHTRIGVRGMLAHTYLEWARMLLVRRQPPDAERARDLLGQARATARELGLGNIERQAIALLHELP